MDDSVPRRGAPASGRRVIGGTVALLAAVAPVTTRAESTLQTSAYAQYEYNSNVYALSTGVAVPGTTDTGHGDYFIGYGGTFNASELLGRQKLYANLDGTDFHYGHLSQLNHSEYSLAGGWAWQLLRDWDGTLEVRRVRSMVTFANLISSQLELQTEQREAGTIRVQLNPEWRIESDDYTHVVDSPQAQAPALRLTESSAQLALNYTGVARLTAGLNAAYLVGKFDSAGALALGLAPSYHQTSEGVGSQYRVSGLTTIVAQVGYTKRDSSSGINNVGGVTGELHYERTLTGKTSMDLELSRQVNSYITGVGSELDSNASLIVNYQATWKTGFHVNYAYSYRQLLGQGYIPGTDRLDHVQFAGLHIDYEALRWLSLKPYVLYQTRSSNFYQGDFSSVSYGLTFTLQWQKT